MQQFKVVVDIKRYGVVTVIHERFVSNVVVIVELSILGLMCRLERLCLREDSAVCQPVAGGCQPTRLTVPLAEDDSNRIEDLPDPVKILRHLRKLNYRGNGVLRA